MEGEFVEMGKLIGAGLACTGMGGAAVGVGHVVGNFLSGALRNPNAAAGQTATMFIGIAFAEALGIFSFLVALLFVFENHKDYPDYAPRYVRVGYMDNIHVIKFYFMEY